MSPKEAEYLDRINAKCEELGVEDFLDSIYVSIQKQRLFHYRGETLVKCYAASTSREKPSNLENSLGTPNGLHRIAKKIGGDAPVGMVFKGRKAIGLRYWENLETRSRDNLITSRILWLEGLEEGVNKGDGCDSHDRYIYIHGTNYEDEVGTPASHGCILLTNNDIMELFRKVEEQAVVLIE